MGFQDVIGQEDVRQLLLGQVREDRLPHALLFHGPAGCGKMAMALAFAQYLLCQHPTSDGQACGTCSACRQVEKFAHPDLHFSFPIVLNKDTPTCDYFYKEWRMMLSQSPYFGHDDWLNFMGKNEKNTLINDAEGDRIINQMSLAAYAGGYKIMIIWLPERMNDSAANNLLKNLEEPAPKTVYILVSNDITPILPTIISRTQRIAFPPLPLSVLADALVKRNGLERETATQIARISAGSYLKALQYIQVGNNANEFFDLFTQLMRMAYTRDLVGLRRWCDEVTEWGRERQKAFLGYCQNMIRENFIYNFKRGELNFMSEKETQFAVKFSRFVNERNVKGFVEQLSQAQRDIEHNVYSKTVFFDLALKVTVLVRR